MVSNPYESQGVQGYDDSLDKIAALQAQLDQAKMQRQAEIAGNKDLGFSDRERALQALDSGYAVASGNLNTQRIGLDSQRRIASDVAFTDRMRQRDLQSQQAEAAGRQQAMALNTGMGLSEDGQRSIGLSPRGQTQQAAPGKGSAPDDADFNAFQRDLHALVGAGREEQAKRLFASKPGYWGRLGVPRQIYTPEEDMPGLRAGNREEDGPVNMAAAVGPPAGQITLASQMEKQRAAAAIAGAGVPGAPQVLPEQLTNRVSEIQQRRAPPQIQAPAQAAVPTVGLVPRRPEGHQARPPLPGTEKDNRGFSAEDVKAAYRAGNITRDQAKAALKRFGYQ